MVGNSTSGEGETDDEGLVEALGEILADGDKDALADDEGLIEGLGEMEGLGLTLGDIEDEGEIAGAPETERISIVPVAVGPADERVRLPLDVAPPRLND